MKYFMKYFKTFVDVHITVLGPRKLKEFEF